VNNTGTEKGSIMK